MGHPCLIPSLQYTLTPSKKLALQHIIYDQLTQKLSNVFDNTGQKQTLDQLLQGSNASIWKVATSKKVGRLTQGIRNIKGNDEIEFIHKYDVPLHKKVT